MVISTPKATGQRRNQDLYPWPHGQNQCLHSNIDELLDERETIQLNVSTPGSSDLGTSFNTDEITLSNSELSSQALALQELEEINKSPYAQPRRKKN